jgi:hypothetical protein
MLLETGSLLVVQGQHIRYSVEPQSMMTSGSSHEVTPNEQASSDPSGSKRKMKPHRLMPVRDGIDTESLKLAFTALAAKECQSRTKAAIMDVLAAGNPAAALKREIMVDGPPSRRPNNPRTSPPSVFNGDRLLRLTR